MHGHSRPPGPLRRSLQGHGCPFAPQVLTVQGPVSDPTLALSLIPRAVDYLFGLTGQSVEILVFDPREDGCTALPCAKCHSYHTRIKLVHGRETYTVMQNKLGIAKVSGRGCRSFSVGLVVECLEGYCKHLGSTTNADFLRLLPREVSVQYPCDPGGAEGKQHVTRRVLTVLSSLVRSTDAGASAVVRAELEADGVDFEVATLLLSAANGKHWTALSHTVGDAAWSALDPEEQRQLQSARELYELIAAGEVRYERVGETGLLEHFGTSMGSVDVLQDSYWRKLSDAAPFHERELQLAGASSHASGDHCAPLGQAFQLKGLPSRQMYVANSTNRGEILGVYLVPNTGFESIRPALEGMCAGHTWPGQA